MLKVERYRCIGDLLSQKEAVSVEDIEKALHVSRATIYRDIKDMIQLGMVAPVRGGITSISEPSPVVEESVYNKKKLFNAEEKTRIARFAVDFIRPNETIFLDSSTTIYHMCPFLKEKGGLSLTTNDVRIAGEFSSVENLSVYVTGGRLRHNYYTLIEHNVDRVLNDINIDAAFFSCDAIMPGRGCMITNDDEVPLKRAVIQKASRCYVLCDHTKFNRTAFIAFAGLKQFDKVITGSELPESTKKAFIDAGIDIVCV